METKYFVFLLTSASAVFLSCMMMMSFNKLSQGGGDMKKIVMQSNDFTDGQRLNIDQTCEGKNISPSLSWGNGVVGVKSFSIVCDDPDAPSKTWVHWVIFNIPASVNSLPAAVSADAELPSGARQGVTDFGTVGFGGACPPKGHGTHHYFFKIYALDTMLDLQAGCSKADLETAMTGHILAGGQLVGTYSREK